MKITALLVLKWKDDVSNPIILANTSNVSRFGYFQRSSVKEFIVFVGRTAAKRTLPGQCQSVQHEVVYDDSYPVRSAFSLLNKVMDEYQNNFGNSWKTAQEDSTQPWPYLNDAITKFQHKTIDSVLERGEKLDTLVDQSSDLSAASQNIPIITDA